MKNEVTPEKHGDTTGVQQLALLTVPPTTARELKPSSAHARFRLNQSTRSRGLAHVAQIRRQLAESQARRDARHDDTRSPHRPHAA